MRLLLAVAVAVVGSPDLRAQSLDESYSKLCSSQRSASSETCKTLAEGLAEKRQRALGLDAPPPALPGSEYSRWGPLSKLAGTSWSANDVNDPEYEAIVVHRFTENAAKDEIEMGILAFGIGKTTLGFRPGKVPGVFDVLMRNSHGKRSVQYRLAEGRSLVSDWFKMPGTSIRARFRLTIAEDGTYYTFDEVYAQDPNVKEPPFGPPRVYRKYAGPELATLMARGKGFEGDVDAFIQDGMREAHQQQQAEKAQRSRERAEALDAVLQGVTQGLSEVHDAQQLAQAEQVMMLADTRAMPARQQNAPHESSYEASGASPRQQLQGAATSSPSPTPASAGKPLRFVLMISMRNLPGDKVNSTCYSNVITRDGPPAWGGSGFLPPGSGEQARQTIESLKAQFIAACQAGGRQISSAGNFNWVWNQMPSDEQKFASARAKYSEDVSVSVQ